MLTASCLPKGSFHQGYSPWPVQPSIVIKDYRTEENIVYLLLLNESQETDAVITYAESLPLPSFYSFKGVHYPGEGGNCKLVIPKESECVVVLEKSFPLLVSTIDFTYSSIEKFKEKSKSFWLSLKKSP